MSVLDTLLVFALIPAGIYAVVALLTLWPKFSRPRYRSGDEWDFPPVWWLADPSVLESSDEHGGAGTHEDDGSAAATARGGARGSW